MRDVRLRGWVVETPVLESEAHATARVGARVLLKAECLQHGGSFKIRGALNRLLQLSHADERARRRRRVLVGQPRAGGGARRTAGSTCRATIVMPADAPQVKARTHARVRRGGRALRPRARGPRGDRGRLVAERARRRARAAVRSSARHRGAGHCSRSSSARVARARHVDHRRLYAPCSGGGLVARLRARDRSPSVPSCAVYAVEPRGLRGSRGFARSRRAATVAPGSRRRLCDGCARRCRARSRSRSTGASSPALAPSTTTQIRAAMALAAQHLKVVVRAVGAAALARRARRSRTDVSVRCRRAVWAATSDARAVVDRRVSCDDRR